MTDPSTPHSLDRPDDFGMTEELRSDTLVIQWPNGQVEHRVLLPGVTRIGRRQGENEIVVPAELKTISSKHAEIRISDSGAEIVDLGSVNGTYVNGAIIREPTRLEDQTAIEIGSQSEGHRVRIVFRSEKLIPTGAAPVEPIRAAPPPPPGETAYLSARWPDGQEVMLPLTKDVILLGRSPQTDLVFPAVLNFVSNRHAEIRRGVDVYTIQDLGSTNGTRLNNEMLLPQQPRPLGDGDIIRIGDERFGASIGVTFHDPAHQASAFRGYSSMDSISIAVPSPEHRILIGRVAGCDIMLDSPNVSRNHAEIRAHNGGHRIVDLDSSNGTYVNGHPIREAVLKVGDIVQIGQHLLVYDGQTLTRFDSQGMRMDVLDVYKQVRTPKGPVRILDDISLTVMPREFVALVGGSGAGKSTLMDALNGFRPAKGQILLNGRDFYKSYNQFRTELGYVPQHDILHTSLTVEHALGYAARLRLPSDISPAERNRRIAEVLETVGMNNDKVRKTRISNLSGGQRKRVSIAAELLAEPKLFFLDEPTSGLDPGLEKKMMYTMRQMADEGRTIILITHATSNIVQVDHVAFLSQGKLVYFGPPQEALDFFEVTDFADIYEKIERHGDEWRKTFTENKPQQFQQHVVGRQQTRKALLPTGPARRQAGFAPLQWVRQFIVFSQRMFDIIFSERLTLTVLLAVMPLVAAFVLLMAKPYTLVGEPDIVENPEEAAEDMEENYTPTKDAQTTLFIMSLASVLLGMFVASNELVGERSVYLRERMVNLKIVPYLASKLAVFAFFAAIQAALLLAVLAVKLYFPEQGQLLPGPVEMYVTLFIATLASVGVGLLISALAASSNMVIYIILIMLFIQIIFSGAIFEMRNKPIEPVSYLTLSHWTLVGLGTTVDMNELAEATIVCGKGPIDDPTTPDVDETEETICTNKPIASDDMVVAYGDDILDILGVWTVLSCFGVGSIVMTFVLVKRMDRA